jgi:LPXTG-motif cell wall-anchored protein
MAKVIRLFSLVVILLISVTGTVLAQEPLPHTGGADYSYVIFAAVGAILLAAGLALRNIDA